jgi:molybdopterin synthase catalytic subunit
MFEATQTPILPHLVLSKLKRDTHGALVSFIGTARGYSSEGKRVLFVECEGDKEVVEQALWEVGEDICKRWQLEDVALCHRLGRIGVGETIFVAAIAAAHRQEAFEACQYAIDRVKERVRLGEVLEGA